MAYFSQYQMAYDSDLAGRVTQAVASEVQSGHTDVDPERWAADKRHHWAASPGWDAAWESALAAQNPNPGRDGAVISDLMILSTVQALLGV
jgi:hypothetical protein